ncbi:hypothetical protein KP014_21030 [Paenibacillus sophorae]|uniref:Uncharacterized protein n=1 Tax=Paenibacillus sophorae TaxID=1333845 RepID=A0ABX8H870_9BACL|nr:hypothetical protein [Paenibacillus sophorae]QWU14394.1 hypothetical protein KP014_21030 [Paenibacillus sophorae]
MSSSLRRPQRPQRQLNTKSHATITKLYYQAESGYYIAETNRDKQGGFWTLDVVRVATKKENKTLTKQLKQQYINKKVHIIYVGDEQTDEEIEIIDSYIE